MTNDDVRDMLRSEVSKAKTLLAWALDVGVSPTYVGDVLRGTAEPGVKILRVLGLERVVTYRRVGG